MNNSFGYTDADTNFKSAKTCIHQLVNCVSKNGNYLLNVGPDARGNIPSQSRKILEEIGDWMRLNSESIYGCHASSTRMESFGCRITEKDHVIYLHVMEQPVGPLALTGIHNSQIKAARFLGTGAEAEVLTSGWAVQNYPTITFISLAGQSNETIALPDERDTVIKLILQAK